MAQARSLLRGPEPAGAQCAGATERGPVWWVGVQWSTRGGVQSLSQVVTGINLSVRLNDGQCPRAEWGDQLKTLGSSAGCR